MGVKLFELGVKLFELGVELFELGVDLFELGVELFELGVELFELGVDLGLILRTLDLQTLSSRLHESSIVYILGVCFSLAFWMPYRAQHVPT